MGLVLWAIGRCLRLFNLTLIGLRLLKQGFITLIIFNVFNIGFSIGIHSMYAEKSNSKNVFNIVAMAIALCSVLVATLVM